MTRFTTLRHRTRLYWNRNLKNNVKVKLDLTKTRYTIFTHAIESVNQPNVANYVIVKLCHFSLINYFLKVKLLFAFVTLRSKGSIFLFAT